MTGVDGLVRAVRLLFLLAGAGLLGFGLFGIGDTWLKVAEARGWPTTEGTVLNRSWRSETSIGRTSTSQRFVPEIRYRYSVAGQIHVSENVYPAAPERWDSQEELQAFMDSEFPARGPVTVSYDPAQPSRAAIILRGTYGTAITLAICGLVALGGLWAIGFAGKEDAKGR